MCVYIYIYICAHRSARASGQGGGPPPPMDAPPPCLPGGLPVGYEKAVEGEFKDVVFDNNGFATP